MRAQGPQSPVGSWQPWPGPWAHIRKHPVPEHHGRTRTWDLALCCVQAPAQLLLVVLRACPCPRTSPYTPYCFSGGTSTSATSPCPQMGVSRAVGLAGSRSPSSGPCV